MKLKEKIDNGEITFKEEVPREKGFAKHYEKEILPELLSFEEKRIRCLKKCTVTFIICIFSVPYLYNVINSFEKSGLLDAWAFVLKALVCLIAISLIFRPILNYDDDVKKNIYSKIFKFYDGFIYDPFRKRDLMFFKESGILPSFNLQQNEDYIFGHYKGVKFEILEVELKKVTATRNRRAENAVFDGLLMSISMNKDFSGITRIFTDRGRATNFLKNSLTVLERVELEDTKFEKLFEVYSTNQVEARYLLSPSFMENLRHLSIRFDNAKVEAAFYNKHLILKIPYKKSFLEPYGLLNRATFIEESKIVIKDVQMVFEIIESLKLDIKTGL